MTNKIITLRDRLAKGGIEDRVFALRPPSEFEKFRHPLVPTIVNLYEAKGIVSCLTQDGKSRSHVLARKDRGNSVPTETWLYLPIEEVLNNQEVRDAMFPESGIDFKRQPYDKQILEMPFGELHLSDKHGVKNGIKVIARQYGPELLSDSCVIIHPIGCPEVPSKDRPVIRKVGDALHYSPSDLGNLKMVGTETINRLMAYLGQYGLGLRQS